MMPTGSKHSSKTKEKQKHAALKQFKDGMPQETKDKIRKANSGKKNGMFGKKRANHQLHCTCSFCRAERSELTGKCNPKYIEGYTKKGNRYYIWIHTKRILLARYVAEKCLKRKLTASEIVHHINKNPLDDRPENLYVFSSQSKHCGHHFLKNASILISNLI